MAAIQRRKVNSEVTKLRNEGKEAEAEVLEKTLIRNAGAPNKY